VVTTLKTTGPAAVKANGEVVVPIRVIVLNQGDVAADIFKVSTEYSQYKGVSFVVPFTVPGQGMWYPFTSALLAGGSEVIFAGQVTFLPQLQGKTVYLKARADSCRGDEFMPKYCRVQESDEGNNTSAAITLSLPSDLPPTVEIAEPASDSRYGSEGYDEELGLWYANLLLWGSASDAEDGALGGSSLVWRTDRQDIQSSVLGTGEVVKARLYSNVCAGVWHEITLTATDSDGHATTAVARILIWILC
jgi:hypothetical protein